jgi:hypothetical protein
LFGQGSAIDTLLRKMNGPGVVPTVCVTMCQLSGITIENGPRPTVLSSVAEGEDNGEGLRVDPPILGTVDWDAPGAAASNLGRSTATTRMTAIARATDPTGRSERVLRPDTRRSPVGASRPTTD